MPMDYFQPVHLGLHAMSYLTSRSLWNMRPAWCNVGYSHVFRDQPSLCPGTTSDGTQNFPAAVA